MSSESSSSGSGSGSGLLSSITSGFSSPSEAGLSSGSGIKEFMESNSYVAKFAFLVMIVLLFTIFMKVAIIVLSYFMLPSMSPYVLDGTASSDNPVPPISQDPGVVDSIFIGRSMNEDGGLEYTWSAWFIINDAPATLEKYSRIFSKGGAGAKLTTNNDFMGIYYPNNAPGLYIKKTADSAIVTEKKISLAAVVDVDISGGNSISDMNEVLIATDIPMKKWVNAMIRVTNNVIDLYVNGRLAQRKKTAGIPIQNYGKVNIGENTAGDRFTGFISTIQYFNYAIGSNKIMSVVDAGPNLKMATGQSTDTSAADSVGTYLSNKWYFH
jgi:hypothetical protein